MAFDKYKNGAWMEPEDSVKRYSNGAWVDCESVKKYKDGAWTEVWANKKIMTETSNEITKGILTIADNGLTFNFFKFKDYYNGTWYGSQEGGGNITFVLDGLWNNPTFTFDWTGGFIYKVTQSATTWNRVSAGEILIGLRSAGSTRPITFQNAVNTVGSTVSESTSVTDESGSCRKTINGTFDQIGLRIYINSFAGDFFNSVMTMIVKNFMVSGQKIGFPASSAFDIQEFPS